METQAFRAVGRGLASVSALSVDFLIWKVGLGERRGTVIGC